jgi:hypothetical protein
MGVSLHYLLSLFSGWLQSTLHSGLRSFAESVQSTVSFFAGSGIGGSGVGSGTGSGAGGGGGGSGLGYTSGKGGIVCELSFSCGSGL